jgi:hypothetical protein
MDLVQGSKEGQLCPFISAVESGGTSSTLGSPRFTPLLLVENHCGGYRLAFGVSSFGSLRHRLAISGNDVLTLNMVLSTGLFNVKDRRTSLNSIMLTV